ncbi:hypothetical protein JHK82_012308 [Glycine max]|nr:hypothetical protein JHK85_012662 [Glycine max]KAG5154339.1 hypothetical protein JHK82_012308 [Glycine max]
MLSAIICYALGYPTFIVGTITGTLELTYRFNGRTTQPLEHTIAPGGKETTSSPSTRHCRITKADFPPCSTGGSCSQAPFCLCTQGTISVWPEETFARVRYLLEGLCLLETVPQPVGPRTRASVVGSPVIRSPTSLTFGHWASISPHTWSYDFEKTCVFGKQSPGPSHYDPFVRRHPFSRSYRAIFQVP